MTKFTRCTINNLIVSLFYRRALTQPRSTLNLFPVSLVLAAAFNRLPHPAFPCALAAVLLLMLSSRTPTPHSLDAARFFSHLLNSFPEPRPRTSVPAPLSSTSSFLPPSPCIPLALTFLTVNYDPVHPINLQTHPCPIFHPSPCLSDSATPSQLQPLNLLLQPLNLILQPLTLSSNRSFLSSNRSSFSFNHSFFCSKRYSFSSNHSFFCSERYSSSNRYSFSSNRYSSLISPLLVLLSSPHCPYTYPCSSCTYLDPSPSLPLG